MGDFRFRQFTVSQDRSALKTGTDAVLLGSIMTLPDTGGVLLDIGTGSGVIALMAAQRLAGCNSPDWRITAIDIDGPSIEDARDNFAASPWAGHLSARHCSLEEFGRDSAEDLYHAIFSNPPYYDNSLPNPDAREAEARHTSTLSYRDILAFAADRLIEGEGILSLILPSEEERRLLRTAASFGLFPFRMTRIRTVEGKAPRRTVAEFRRCNGTGPVCSEEELTLQRDGRKTEEYTELCREFYL